MSARDVADDNTKLLLERQSSTELVRPNYASQLSPPAQGHANHAPPITPHGTVPHSLADLPLNSPAPQRSPHELSALGTHVVHID